MLASIFVFFALAPSAVGLSTLKQAHLRGRFSKDRMHFIRGSGDENCNMVASPFAPESTVCTKGDASVVQQGDISQGKWYRRLQFSEDECAVETMVLCKRKEACDSDCPDECPCEVDTTAPPIEYQQIMLQQLDHVCSKQHSHVLLIGLGGGRLPQYLLRQCQGMHLEAVELNADVIALGRSYLGLNELEKKFSDRFLIEQNDALSSVQEREAAAGEQYDAILVDCFLGGAEVPESCRSRDFAQKVDAILKPSGMMLQNIWHTSPMNEHVQQQFEDTTKIYGDVFHGSLQNMLVITPSLPSDSQWQNVLKVTKMDGRDGSNE